MQAIILEPSLSLSDSLSIDHASASGAAVAGNLPQAKAAKVSRSFSVWLVSPRD
jgi:hypothetical protein